MCAMQRYPNNNFYNHWQQYPPMTPPQPPKPKYRFRWAWLVGIPFFIGFLLWMLNGIKPAFEFKQLMQWLDVQYEDQYVRLACLAVILISVTLIVKAIKKSSE